MGYKVTKKNYKLALKGTMGIISTIAKNLGVERTTLYKFLKRHPDMEELRTDERDKILDKSEHVMYTKANEGNMRAAEFLLNKLGKDRGFGDTAKIDLSGVVGLSNSDTLISAYKKREKEVSLYIKNKNNVNEPDNLKEES